MELFGKIFFWILIGFMAASFAALCIWVYALFYTIDPSFAAVGYVFIIISIGGPLIFH